MKDLGDTSFVLRIQIHQDCSQGIHGLSQNNYIKNILKRFGMQDCKLDDNSIFKGDKLCLKALRMILKQ